MIIKKADKTANYKLHMVDTSHLLQLSITTYTSYCSCPIYMNTQTPLAVLLNSQDWDVVLKTLMQNLGQKSIMYVKESNFLLQYTTEFSLLLTEIKLHLPMYKYQSCGAKPLMNVWANFVIKTQTAKMLSGILSQTLKIHIPATVPVNNNKTLFSTWAG